MKRLPSLIRAGLKSNFGLSVLFHRLFKEKKDRWLVPVIALAVIGALPTLYGILLLIKSFYLFLRPMGQERAILTFAVLMGQSLILLFGLYYVISAFYFSKDLEMLIPLPLKPFEVMLSKFTIILVNEYLTVFLIVAPVLIYFGILAKSGVAYWINVVLVYLFLPIIPLTIVSILVVAMMRVVNFSRKKDALIIIGSILLITAAIGLQFMVNRSAGPKPEIENMSSFFASPDSLLNRVGAKFPPSIWATKALAGGLTGSGLFNLLVFVGVSLLLFCGILVMAEKLFYRGLIGLGEVSGRKKALSQKELSRKVSSGRRPVKAIFAREWRIMNRTPIFLLNGVLVVIIVPLIFILMTKMGSGRGDNAFILKVLVSAAKPAYAMLAAACFMIICSSLNGTASSTFSREGIQFWMSKVIPVSPQEQVIAKYLHSFIIALLGLASSSIVLIVVIHLKIALLAAALAMSLAATFFLTAVGMIIDLARPLLDWTNPQKAIKQNLNVLLAMLADIGLLGSLGFLLFFLAKAGISWNTLLIGLFGTFIILSFLSFRFLVHFAEKRYKKIEV
jgi:ABC-2 type transport system permease protein